MNNLKIWCKNKFVGFYPVIQIIVVYQSHWMKKTLYIYLDYFTAFLLLNNRCIVSVTIGESGPYDNKETLH